MTSRERVALGSPPDDLSGFPTWQLRRTTRLWRAHGPSRSPWWFSSDLSCRFDLPAPDGTCYLATSPDVAVRERFGARLVRAGFLAAAEVEGFVVSDLRVPQGVRVADVATPAAAALGVTGELSTVVPYALPQQWAAALHAVGLGGVRYAARFTPSPRPAALALFGPSGEADWPSDPDPTPGKEAAVAAGLRIITPPRRAVLRMTRPPGVD